MSDRDMTWRDIETAPKDDYILVCFADGSALMLVVYFDEAAENLGFSWATLDGPSYHKNAFSHWMPLPEPPQ